jgi:hypothetical protein
MSVSKAARYLADKYDIQDRAFGIKQKAQLYSIAFPLLIVDGVSVEAYLDDDNELQVNPISSGVLTWRNPVVREPHTIIHVVTREGLSNFARGAAATFRWIARQVGPDPAEFKPRRVDAPKRGPGLVTKRPSRTRRETTTEKNGLESDSTKGR